MILFPSRYSLDMYLYLVWYNHDIKLSSFGTSENTFNVSDLPIRPFPLKSDQALLKL